MPAQANSRAESVKASPRGLWTAAAFLIALRIALGIYESHHPPKTPDKVHWVAAAEASKSASHNKPVLYAFSASWCGPCKLMQREVFGDKSIADRINQDFTPVHVLEGGEPGLTTAFEASELQEKYGVGGYPTLVVVADDRSPSTLSGYPGKDGAKYFLYGGWQNNPAPQNLRDFRAEVKRRMEAMADGGLIGQQRLPSLPIESEQEILDRAISDATKEVEQAGRGGAVIVGKIELSSGEGDPRATWAQVQILPGGNFAAAVRADAKVLQFRQDGYAAMDLPLDPATLKGTVHVPPVVLRKLSLRELARIHGHVTAPRLDTVGVNHGPLIESVSPRGGTKGSPFGHAKSVKVSVSSTGVLSGEGFSPGPHFLTFSGEGTAHVYRTVDLKPGEDFDLGEILLELVKTITVRYCASDSNDFSEATVLTKTVHGDEGLHASDRAPSYAHSIFFEQRDSAIRITSKYGPWKAYDLGPGKVEDFRRNVTPSSQPVSTTSGQKLEPGHVYLSENTGFKEWVLFEGRISQ